MARPLDRQIGQQTVRCLARYAGIELGGDEVHKQTELLDQMLRDTQSWDEHFDLGNTRPAHIYRLRWEVLEPLRGRMQNHRMPRRSGTRNSPGSSH